jgi:hypothetical protein
MHGVFSPNPDIRAIQLTKMLYLNQSHAYHHVPSCVKKKATTVCRYPFPKKLVQHTGFDTNGKFSARRTMGNQWLNSYIPAVRKVFSFNMDARFLMCGDGAQSAMYATKYATKSQTTFDNLHVIEIAFNKRVQRELCSEEEVTDHTRGIGRLLALARAATDIMEIGGPLACHYLNTGSGSYFSAEFQVLLLTDTLNVLCQKDVHSMLVKNLDTLIVRTVTNDYTHRPAALESIGSFDLTSWY